MNRFTLPVILLILPFAVFAQRGKDGNATISTAKVVNEYTTLTANASSGNTSITVANSNLNTNGRFTGNLAPGDLIMIIQMQGATINGSPSLSNPNLAVPDDSTWGSITAYNNAGNYEFEEVSSVPNGTTIDLDCPLTNNYTSAGRVQVIRVPRYNTLTINSGGSIGCDPWDSAKGGVVAIEVLGNTVINSGGKIDVSNNGFRGATLTSDSSNYGVWNTTTHWLDYGKGKGESIAGHGWMYKAFGGEYCKGAPANGGGGANAHNGGGGGGANGGVPSNWINGFGNPDVSVPNYVAAWNLEYSWMSAFTSSGGGRGGYTFSSQNLDPTTNKPNNSAWAGDDRDNNGGRGGRPVDYSTGRLFLGGGGGAGDQDDGFGGAGANGAGLVYLMSYGTVSGSGQIVANGQNGYNAQGTAAFGKYAGQDGAGGAGAGGTIVVNSVGAISSITLNADGGTGGNQVFSKNFFFGTITEAEGPGGGGGGGYIATSNSGPTETANGGANGTTGSPTMTKFPANGATKGGAGTTGATVTNFQIVCANDTICSGLQATLSATLTGTVPPGTGIEWYTTQTGGSSIGSGATYTTPTLATTTTYYVGTCPGTYRQAVTVVVSGAAVTTISASPDTICNGQNTSLTATGGSAYLWAPSGSLNNANIATPTAAPTVTTTYTVSITTACGVKKDSITITVRPTPLVTLSGTTTICAGNNTTITAGGGVSYLWSTGATTAAVTLSPASTTTYTVHVSNGACSKDTTVTVTVNPLPVASVSGTSPVCAGESSTITASGGTGYSWSNGATTAAITVTPASTTTYTVHVSNGGCTKDTTFTVTVNPIPSVSVSPPSPGICPGGNVLLTASGASTYSWAPATGLSCTNCANPTANPGSTTTYTVVGTGAAGCTDTAYVTVTVGSLTASITGNDSICAGNSTVLTANGGTNYVWSDGETTNTIMVSPSSNTSYSVTVSNGGCKDSTNVTVVVNPLPIVSVTGSSSICAGDSTTLKGGGGVSYTWSTGATTDSITVKPAADTTYTLTVSNGTCTKDTAITVIVNNKPVPTINNGDTLCSGTPVQLTAGGGTSYTWTPSAGLSSSTISNPIATPTTTTQYTVTVANGGCSATDSVMIVVNPSPVASASGSTTIVSGNSAPLVVTPGSGYKYKWYPSTGLNCDTCLDPNASPTVTTVYYVTVTDSAGCSITDSVIITVEANCGQLFIPDAFSPNGDQQNDILFVRGNCISSMQLDIYDRWGNKVFESVNQNEGWDGTYKGQPMQTGTYVWVLTANLVDGTIVNKKGNVSLVK